MRAVEQASGNTLADGDGRPRYVLGHMLGEGAVGRVYRASDVNTGREVALKTLKAVHVEHVYHLKQEFRALYDITHPNLVRLHELVVADELAYFAMELIDGVQLLDWVWADLPPATERPLDDEQIARVRQAFGQLASALDTLHAHGRLHRDVKPSNVLVTPDGRLALVDLGISVDVGSALGRASMSGRVSGTRGYMSPEQASGRILTASSDWYTFGVLLFQALTGRLPRATKVQGWSEPDMATDDVIPERCPADLARLTAALLSIDPSARPTAAQVLAALPGSRASGWRRRDAKKRVFGRDADSARLHRALAQSRESGVHVVTVTGASGVGKTALVEAFLDEAAQEAQARVLRARCHHREKLLFKALDGVIDDLSEYLRQLPRGEIERYMPPQVGALLQVFPQLTRAFGTPAEGLVVSAGLSRPGALASLRHLLGALAVERPLVLWVDDIEWADRDSLMALQAIVGPMGVPGYTVILSYRGAGIEEQRFISELLADVGSGRRTEIALRPLETPDLLELARDVAPDLSDPAIVQLVRTSGGMPLFVREFARDLSVHGDVFREDQPGGLTLLSYLLDVRLAQLSESTKTAFGVLCVAGFPLEERALVHMLGADPASLALAELRDVGLVCEMSARGAVRLEVPHDQLREVFLERESSAELQRWTALLERALDELGTSDPLFQVEMLAQAAPQEALTLAQEAARRARSRGAVQLEAMLLDRASDLAVGEIPADMLADLGRALLCCGRSHDGAGQLALAADLAQERGDLHLATRWRAAAGEHLMAQGHIREGLDAMTRALSAIGTRYESTPVRALAWLVLHMPLTAWRKTMHRFRRGRVIPLDQATRVRLDVLWAAGAAVAHAEPVHAMQFHARHALLTYAHGDPANIALSTCEDGVITAMRGGPARWRRAQEQLAAARKLADEAGDRPAEAFIEAQVAAAHYFAGEWTKVLEQVPLAHAALAAARSERISQTGLLCFLELTALSHLGRLNEVRSRSAELKVALATSGNGSYEKCLRLGWNQLACLAWDEVAPAKRDLLRAEPHLAASKFTSIDYVHLLAHANLELYCGSPEAAFALVERAWPRVRRSMQLMLTVPHFDLWELRARVALAATAVPTLRRKALPVARRAARALAKNPLPMARVAAVGLRGGLALQAGAPAEAALCLEQAARGYEGLGLELRARACELLLGLLAGRHDEREGSARRWFDSERVVYPERFAWVLLPAGPPPQLQSAQMARERPRLLPTKERAGELGPDETISVSGR